MFSRSRRRRRSSASSPASTSGERSTRRHADFVARIGDRAQQVHQVVDLARLVKTTPAIHQVRHAGLVEGRCEFADHLGIAHQHRHILECELRGAQLQNAPRHPLRLGARIGRGQYFHRTGRGALSNRRPATRGRLTMPWRPSATVSTALRISARLRKLSTRFDQAAAAALRSGRDSRRSLRGSACRKPKID